MVTPEAFTDSGITHLPRLVIRLDPKGDDRWSCSDAIGPLPSACAWMVKPTNATIARLHNVHVPVVASVSDHK
jgi:hypothetical protein